ncbi:MAG: carotenoid 1,2-hydratase [Deltaproteobacteria bacterium]|nr:carotenoid 1,2-hydratase [Deltaproteobacteria bacterium]
MFSPAYFRARRRSLLADPMLHCALNVVVHGPGGDAWALTEYRGLAVTRERDRLRLGDSLLERDDDGLSITLREQTSPWRRPIRGRVRLEVDAWTDTELALDRATRHCWWPVAPSARIEVELERPRLSFRGSGYHDSNAGIEPLECALAGWSWSRAPTDDGVALLYDVRAQDGEARSLGLHIDRQGRRAPLPAPDLVALPPTRWRLSRPTRVDAGGDATLRRSLVDTPFYARSLIDTRLHGAQRTAVHESIALDRFVRRSTQLMLPFRTRGVGWW